MNEAQAMVDKAIVETIMPQLYVLIDDLLDHAPDAPRELVMRAKKMLPDWAPHSMLQSPPAGKKK